MAVVFVEIAASIFSGSRLQYIGSISAKTGCILFQCRAWVVATKLKGVVITAPELHSRQQIGG